MKKEIEQKKDYFAPKMEVIDMGDDTALLHGSNCVEGDDCDITTIFKKD